MPAVVMYMRSALPCSTTLVSPPAMTTPARARGLGHGANFGFQNFGRQAGFEHEGDHQRLGARARDGEIVDRAVDRQFADGAARESAAGFTTKLSVVMARRVPFDLTCAASPSGSADGAEEKRREQAFDQPAAGLAARAVRHLDLRDRETGSWATAACMACIRSRRQCEVSWALRCS